MEVFEKAKNINLQMMEYAMEILDKEEATKVKQQKKSQKKQAQDKLKNQSLISGALTTAREHLVLNIGMFGVLLLLWLVFRDDVFKYMFDNNRKGFK